MKLMVEDVMTKVVATVKEATSFKDMVSLMAECEISALPVVDERDRLVGIVSEADLLLKEEGSGHEHLFEGRHRRTDRAKSEGLTARDVMTTPVISIAPDVSIRQAARVMHEKRVKRLPVIDGEGRVVGIVSRSDLLRVFLRPDKHIEREVEVVLDRVLMAEPGSVRVVVRNGIVLLRGQLERRSHVGTVVDMVRGVDGVVGVEPDLTWECDDLTPPVTVTPWGVYAGTLRP
jgi:CBS domain-containing protein